MGTVFIETRDSENDVDDLEEELLEQQPDTFGLSSAEETSLIPKSSSSNTISNEEASHHKLLSTNNQAAAHIHNRNISYGTRASRDDYSESDLHVAGIVTKTIKLAYNQWLRVAESKASSSSRNKRDSHLTLRLSCHQAVIERLNFSQYRSNYNALLDIFNISVVDNSNASSTDPAVMSTNPQRVQFLERFMNTFLDRLSGGSTNNPSVDCLPALIAAINHLPDAY